MKKRKVRKGLITEEKKVETRGRKKAPLTPEMKNLIREARKLKKEDTPDGFRHKPGYQPQFDYKLVKKDPVLQEKPELPDDDIWLPSPICAILAGYSNQMIRMLFFNGEIRAIKFKAGPALFNLNEVHKYREKMGKKRKVQSIPDSD